jgi:hypothetical protein
MAFDPGRRHTFIAVPAVFAPLVVEPEDEDQGDSDHDDRR